MKHTVVPAQITTVEDRIAGNLTFIQIMLLVIPLILSTVIYAIISPRLHLSTLKLTMVAIQFSVFGILAIRINGKVLMDWLIIILRYSLRPRIYIFTKNDLAGREIYTTNKPIDRETVQEENLPQKEVIQMDPSNENIDYRNILNNPALTISIKPAKKGGLDVSLRKI